MASAQVDDVDVAPVSALEPDQEAVIKCLKEATADSLDATSPPVEEDDEDVGEKRVNGDVHEADQDHHDGDHDGLLNGQAEAPGDGDVASDEHIVANGVDSVDGSAPSKGAVEAESLLEPDSEPATPEPEIRRSHSPSADAVLKDAIDDAKVLRRVPSGPSVVPPEEIPAESVVRQVARLSKRQSSQELKKEVEETSRPLMKASLSTSVDEKSVRAAYEDVRSDTTDTEWAVFKFKDQNIVCAKKGTDFGTFKSCFADDDRAFGFIRIQMGDEMSKRQKFVFITWVGPEVSVIRRAKMSIDKAMVKNIIKNFAVELQLEAQAEINADYFREQLSRAGGANYGTGFRE